MDTKTIDGFVLNQLRLIELEHREEIDQNKSYQQKLSLIELQSRGICLLKLHKQSIRTGLYGRTIVTFGPKWSSKTLPSNGITSGDVVGVTANNDSLVIISGVVLRVESNSVDVAFDEDISAINGYQSEDNESYNLIKLSNDVTHRRLKSALNGLKKYSLSHNLIQVLFGETDLSSKTSEETKSSVNYFNPVLNESQRNGIEFALNQKDIAIIHGPPGTGKTTVLIEFILQCVCNYGLRVLASAPSNVAVDNILEKLSNAKQEGIVRLGHPARAFTRLQKYSLDAAISRSDEYKIVCDMRSEIQSMVTQRKCCFSEIRSLRKELKRREKMVLKRVLEESTVVLTTLTSGSPDGPLKQILNADGYYPFDVVVIDECSQAMEASAWIVLNCAHKCVLAGDHLQLPPTIISEKAAKEGLEISLMERLIKKFDGKQVVRMLDLQYRMNELIMNWSSNQFYSNELKAYESVKNHSLNDVINGSNICPLVLIDSAGCDMNELDLEDEESKGNEFEADIVCIYVRRLIQKGCPESAIGVISPYNLQVQLIRSRLEDYPNLEIKSIDGFQGREKEVIVLSLVRSNDSHDIGFLCERRRINVAVTRAKRHLALVCDTDTVCNDSTIKTLIDHIHQNGDIVCAQEFRDEMQNLSQTERPLNLRFKTKESVNKSKNQNKSKEMKIKTNFRKISENKEKDSLVLEKEKEFEKKLQKFIESNDCYVLSFSPTLTSFERLLIHKIAESLDLVHESVGEGEDRHIVIQKKISKTCSVGEESNKSEDNSEKNEIFVEKESIVSMQTKTKSKANKTKTNENTVKPKVKTKSDKKPKNIKKSIELPDSEDIDSLLAIVKKADNTCSHLRCKTNITVLGQMCQFCGHRFCLTHSMPEIHGCGDEVKAFVKSTIRKEGKLYPGSGVPARKALDSHKRNYLEKKLTNRINDLKSERNAKQVDKK